MPTRSIQNPARPKPREVTHTQPYCHASAAKHLSGRVDQGRASPQVGRAQNDKVGQDAGVPFVRFMLVTPSV